LPPLPTNAPAATAVPRGAPAPAVAPAPSEDAPDPPPMAIPPTSPAAAVAVAEALRQLGKPYVFGANGPNTFDCSGLTQWAWAKAGVAMPHYTVSQFHAFPHVPLNQLAPGDLVFFNLNLGHVGMYIGNGQYVQAPRTHDVVKISNLAGRNVVGAVRPG
jgi:peptidoglycan DL-endopeptidase CwlO